jgi:peptidoglycan/LPS O-acetylase OafA/YrhL
VAIETKKNIHPPIFPALADTRYRSLDMWRGVACLMIVVLHASLWAKFDDNAIERTAHPLASIAIDIFHRFGAGVPIFFVISGYCIAATADSTRRRSKRITFDYFKRRLRRIIPPYWAMIAIAIALSVVVEMAGHANLLTLSPTVGAIPRPASLTLTQWLGNLTLTEICSARRAINSSGPPGRCATRSNSTSCAGCCCSFPRGVSLLARW